MSAREAKRFIVRVRREDVAGYVDSEPIEGRRQADAVADDARLRGCWAVVLAVDEDKKSRKRSGLKVAPSQMEVDTLLAFIDGALNLTEVGQALGVNATKGAMQHAQYRLARIAMRAIASGVFVRRET